MYRHCLRVAASQAAGLYRPLATSAINNALPSMAGGKLGKKAAKAGKAGSPVEKKVVPVETDPERLVQYCCGSNIMADGEDVKLGPDSEYPDWLWELDTSGVAPPLETLSPDTLEYWWLVRNRAMRRNNQLLAKRKLKR
ncbi:39S ribosomal protein L54, mitochondrial-like [Amphibalanus amphitrite]|uniref:39S ribosomal protein L54, mitochondrial-like n=1 Tax=Amphibalanus amphitrite TaxID=1232801 RepID=UPI001C90D722|nr:39S ribosomal protein L54, mitochondrial-like [Amphibalanus amphitrite]XP_043213811.1 39S ribosomal protein L54, mitochondrial-like [Amphibalanus amphitrite]XP_043213813.1 39S ribosomal protein L54, mitochondrial-like [Amphibalanus amphitrite]